MFRGIGTSREDAPQTTLAAPRVLPTLWSRRLRLPGERAPSPEPSVLWPLVGLEGPPGVEEGS